MDGRLVGDRFIEYGDGLARDLATGETVHLTVLPLPSSSAARPSERDDEIARSEGRTGLIDFGAVGLTHVFEARTTGADDCRVRDPARIDTRVRAVLREAPSATHATRVVRVSIVDERDTRLMARAIARQVRAAGFVPVRADLPHVEEMFARLAHRHVALLVFADTDPRIVRRWMERLAGCSARGHLVVQLARIAGAECHEVLPDRARERLPVWNARADVAVEPRKIRDPRLGRAMALERRGRYASAERWYRSAMESAGRRGDDGGRVAACRGLIDRLSRRGEWEAAVRVARRTLASVEHPSAQIELVTSLAGVLLACAELGQVEALLAAWSAGQATCGMREPAAFRYAVAELRFWQGRFDECAAIYRELPWNTSRAAFEGLIGWVRRDASALAQVIAGADAAQARRPTWLRLVLDLLTAALARDAPRIGEGAARLEQETRAIGHPRLADACYVIAAEALAFGGEPRDPTRLLTRLASDARRPPLDRLLARWLRARVEGDDGRESEARLHLVRAGVGLVQRWRWGRPDMHLIEAIPELLELVHDAEDDQAALAAVCGWLRRECGAAAAGVLDTERRVIAAEGWTAADRARLGGLSVGGEAGPLPSDGGEVVYLAPARYAGARTGYVAVRGPAERALELSEAASTVAALVAASIRARVETLSAARSGALLTPEILGRSPAIVALRETIARIAATPFAALIEGESGTGKELVARAIHRLSPRRERRFAAINCAALTDELVEAELFGHTRGAFTGAIGPRAGIFEDAHGGSVFLDEVSELSARAQAKLLRVLQEREIRRVGDNVARPIDVRIIAATNQPLAAAVDRGLFRGDLLFRIAVVRIRLPPLRERMEDVPLIASACWRSLVTEAGKRAALGPDAVARLCRHHWPGNVRELQNVLAALVVAAPDRGRVTARHVGQVIAGGAEGADDCGVPLHRLRADCERVAVASALARHGGRRAQAARDLGLSRQGLTKAMRRLGLDGERREPGVA